MNSSRPDLAHRETADRAVRALIHAAEQGHGGSLVINGWPGSASEPVDPIDELDLRVIRVGPDRADPPGMPFSLDLRALADATAAATGDDRDRRDLADVARGSAPTNRFLRSVQLHRVLTRLADDGPIALVVDQAERLDDVSAAALAFVAQRVADDPIAVILRRTRAPETTSPLDDLALVEAAPRAWQSARLSDDESAEGRATADSLLLTAELALNQSLMDAAVIATDQLAACDVGEADRARQLVALGRLAILRGDGLSATSNFKDAVKIAKQLDTPAAVRTATIARLSLVQIYLRAGRVHLAGAIADELMTIGGAAAELVVTAAQVARGDGGAIRTLHARVENSLANNDPEAAAFVSDTAGLALVWAERYAEADELLDRLAREARLSSALGPLPRVLAVQAMSDLRQSRYLQACIRADEAVRLADATARPGLSSFPASVLAVAEAVRGDEAGCRLASSRLVEQAVRTERDGGASETEVPARAAMGLLHLGLDRPDHAIAHLEPLITLTGTTPWHVLWQMDLAEAFIRCGRLDEARKLTEAFIAGLGSVRNIRARAASARLEALLCAPSDPAEAGLLLEGSERMLRKAGQPLSLGRTLLARGRLRRVHGRAPGAGNDLGEAELIFRSLGALGWEEQARRAARQSPDTLASPAPINPVTLLTPYELQVCALTGAGLTNQEMADELFVSARSIEARLSRIYEKLDLSSRRQLVALSDEWGLPTNR